MIETFLLAAFLVFVMYMFSKSEDKEGLSSMEDGGNRDVMQSPNFDCPEGVNFFSEAGRIEVSTPQGLVVLPAKQVWYKGYSKAAHGVVDGDRVGAVYVPGWVVTLRYGYKCKIFSCKGVLIKTIEYDGLD